MSSDSQLIHRFVAHSLIFLKTNIRHADKH